MDRSLIVVPGRDENEYARLLIEIETRKQRLSTIQADHAELEVALARFTGLVRARLGAMKDEMRDVRLEVEELRQRAARLREDPDAEPQDVEREVEAELRGETAGFDGDPGFRGAGSNRLPAAPPRSIETEAEAMRLYRELAKRYHPDLAMSQEERHRRADLMLKINIAFRDRDLVVLQTFFLNQNIPGPITPSRRTAERLVWARHEVARLDREIADMGAKIVHLRQSEMFPLWASPEASAAALDDLEARTRERLDREKGRLAQARDAYRKLALRRRHSLMMRQRSGTAEPVMRHSSASD